MWYGFFFFIKFWNANYIAQIRNKTLPIERECSKTFSALLLHLIPHMPWGRSKTKMFNNDK